MVASHLISGKQAELAVCQFLKQQSLHIIHTNFSCQVGEIDIIAKDTEFLIFIEVRLRNNKTYGSGLDSVTYSKQQKIRHTAEFYLLKEKLTYKIPVRFDIVSVQGKPFQLEWIKNAF